MELGALEGVMWLRRRFGGKEMETGFIHVRFEAFIENKYTKILSNQLHQWC
jgi:hypothetical protein